MSEINNNQLQPPPPFPGSVMPTLAPVQSTQSPTPNFGVTGQTDTPHLSDQPVQRPTDLPPSPIQTLADLHGKQIKSVRLEEKRVEITVSAPKWNPAANNADTGEATGAWEWVDVSVEFCITDGRGRLVPQVFELVPVQVLQRIATPLR